MILVGTMNWASTRSRGLFRCPQCGDTQSFRLRASRPFLTLYFIPVLPIGGLQQYVECRQCKNSYEPEILAANMATKHLTSQTDKRGQEATLATGNRHDGYVLAPFREDLLKVIALIMVEDGHVTEEEIRVARRIYENMAEENLSREELGHMCAFVQQQRLNTQSFLATARDRRSLEEKLMLVQAIFGVAGADGEISGRRLAALVKAQQMLGLDAGEFQRAVEATDQWLS
jgi:uncharacterized tellurite resistance protein B-like protein